MFPIIFPIVTYDKKEFVAFGNPEGFIEEGFWKEMSDDAMYSSLGIIWLKKPSIKWLLHEFFHHVGYCLKLPLLFHKLVHKVF